MTDRYQSVRGEFVRQTRLRVVSLLAAHLHCFILVLPKGRADQARNRSRDVVPARLLRAVQRQEDEEVSSFDAPTCVSHACVLIRLEKDYTVIRKEEQEEQIEIRVCALDGDAWIARPIVLE